MNFKEATKLISLIENLVGIQKLEILSQIYQQNPSVLPVVVGFTGAPGSGKSTLISKITQKINDEPIVIFAVDPSSHFTGGAILGDRIRFLEKENVFFRSFASRGSYGGLSSVIIDAIRILANFGFPRVIIETTGVGQNEVDIRMVADTVLAVLTPSSGDSIQCIKAGILEICDCIVVNKIDQPGVDYFLKDLQFALQIIGKKNIPIFKVSAESGEGINDLVNFLFEAFLNKKSRIFDSSRRAHDFVFNELIPELREKCEVEPNNNFSVSTQKILIRLTELLQKILNP